MIQINIRQQGAEVSALRSAFYAFLEYAIIHYSTFKERFYERKNSAVCDLFTNKIHHYLMVNMVEESLNIGIHCPVVASFKVCFTLPNCRIGISIGSVTICLLYTSDAADDLLCVDLGGRRIIKKKKTNRSMTK